MESLSELLHPYKDQVGLLASIVTILQFFSGTLICRDIYKRQSTEGISSMPFVGGVVIGVLVLKFSVILQDKNMFNVNMAAILINAVYLVFYMAYSEQKFAEVLKPSFKGAILIGILLTYISFEEPELIEHRYGFIVTVLMLMLMASPLLEVKEIVRNKDASAIPFPLTFMGSIVSFLWLLYGIILLNYFMIIQNIVGLFLCVIQIALCLIYPPPTEKKLRTD